MADEWTVEVSAEVEQWLRGLAVRERAHVVRVIELLESQNVLLGEPHSRQLSGKLRELRLHLQRRQIRISYFIRPGRRITLLTVFEKQQRREPREIDRAMRAMAEYDDGQESE